MGAVLLQYLIAKLLAHPRKDNFFARAGRILATHYGKSTRLSGRLQSSLMTAIRHRLSRWERLLNPLKRKMSLREYDGGVIH